MSVPIVQLENLMIRLSGSEILRGVSLSASEGEYLSVIGPNGAGKTTLVKCLAGILAGWGGHILIEGKPFADYSPRERGRLMSYVPQAEGRGSPLTVEEFVTMGRYPYLSPFTTLKPEDIAAVNGAISRAGLETLRHRRLDTLSGGERQMAFIAAALAQQAKILLLDEPATFLDYRHQAQVAAILHDACRASGITVVAVHHDINLAASCSDHICALKSGVVAFSGTPAALLDTAVLESIYDTPFRAIANHPLPIIIPGGAA